MMSITQSLRLSQLNEKSVYEMGRDELVEFIELTDEHIWMLMEGVDIDATTDRHQQVHIKHRLLDAAKNILDAMCV